MSSISSLGSSTLNTQNLTSQRPTRPSASTVAADIFSNLDTKGQGYLQLSDFESAFASIDGTGTSSSVSDVFAQIDGDGDGKVTQNELSSKLQQLADTLDSQYNQSRMSGATQGAGAHPPPPPPPGGEDAGLSKDQLSSMASDSSSTDSNLGSLLKTVSANFDAADTNSDGRVTFKEAQAYAQKSESSSASTTSSASSSTSSNTSSNTLTSSASSSDEVVLRRILDLVRAYGSDQGGTASSAASAISVSA